MAGRAPPRAALPSGAPTFVFTDVEGSTALLRRLGRRYVGLLDVHRGLILAAADAHGGVHVSSDGDAVFLAFERPAAALAAMADAQRALAVHTWPADAPFRVRMGVHTGPAEVVGDDYVGLAVHVAARVSAAAHGGQVVLTAAVLEQVPDAEVVDLGEHRLKDIPGVVRLFQLAGDGLATAFAPPRTAAVPTTDLPAALDEFVGRADEREELHDALAREHLVTLTGPGGAGKTRLALEVARSLEPHVPDGVRLVELSTTEEPQQVAPLVARAVHAAEAVHDVEAAIIEALHDRAPILILDNCEHVVDAAARLAAQLLESCPGLRILATSREPLGVRGERVMPVPVLGLPPADDPGADPAASDAVRLFAVRAAAVRPSFDARAEIDAVVAVCRRLDGLPLAIELAAARIRSLSPAQLLDRLGDRLHLLRATRRDVPARQRTLEAVVGWSYDVLPDVEQRLFDRVSVFPDSFSLEGAEAVAAGPGVPAEVVADHLGRLVDTSLVAVAATPDGAVRYELLETLRQFGRTRLEQRGETGTVADRLVDWALDHVGELERSMRTPRQDLALAAVRPDHRNLRAAMDRALERGDHLAALRIVSTVPVGLHGERQVMIRHLLAQLPDAPPLVVGHAQTTISTLLEGQGDPAESLVAARLAIDAFERAGDRRNAAWARYFLLFGAWTQGDVATVDELTGTLLDEFAALDDQLGSAWMAWVAAQRATDPGRAVVLAAEAVGRFRALGSPVGLAHALEGRALVALDVDDRGTALAAAREAVELLGRAGSLGCTAHVLEAVAACLVEGGDPLPVAELAGAAEALRARSGEGHRPWERRGHERVLAALGEEGGGAVDRARRRGADRSPASAVARAVALLAEVEASAR